MSDATHRSFTMLYPLLFTPVYKDYVWGGNRICHHFRRKHCFGKVAESWEVSDRDDGMSIIENGPLKGKTLHELFMEEKTSLMGKDVHHERFPLLLKLIDAQENLSVQVHPDDASAKKFGGEGKSEAWVILDAAPESKIYAGLKGNSLKLEHMPTFSPQKGDVFNIPGGRLHAIGAGCLILEIQQNSNTTYRVYDWGRRRPLHLKKAKQVVLCDDTEDPRVTPKGSELIRTPHFVVEKWTLKESQEWPKLKDQWEILFCLEGENSLVPVGRSCLIPAACPPISIETSGTTLFRVYGGH